MIERTPVFDAIVQVLLVLSFVALLLPFWVVLVAASHDFHTVNQVPMPLLPGRHLFENLATAWEKGNFSRVMVNSLIVAIAVTAGKIALAAISAFAIVYFDFRLKKLAFWAIFITLMLPLEVRIVPTYSVAADVLAPFEAILNLTGLSVDLPQWSLLNSYSGLVLPLVATATGTFLYRQFFMTVPDELAEAARMDGSGPLRFFWDILLPLSRANMIALATIMFVFAWNQYLWPLLIITDQANFATATMQLQKVVPNGVWGEPPVWNTAMAANLIVLFPPVLVTLLLQRWFVRGLISAEK
ncbi:sn-glycerol-3-phosphate ABC transporter permease UgpE [Shinella daejeonensis]|uniref:sn-glycerol-3-phosphate ABC transporter permease UgpE n=1 Tax=Shinella daejeonensis TaxID=659017 RepID=UPI0020C7EC00|nr:sn-glycerol-3-phosphate ABC transporter permease UgpE [Shinella daejeonensis]MCP8896494.1 sn-glycerol-3-phosphate ABC transporter permease UgpE [Shinella daejeonensis]